MAAACGGPSAHNRRQHHPQRQPHRPLPRHPRHQHRTGPHAARPGRPGLGHHPRAGRAPRPEPGHPAPHPRPRANRCHPFCRRCRICLCLITRTAHRHPRTTRRPAEPARHRAGIRKPQTPAYSRRRHPDRTLHGPSRPPWRQRPGHQLPPRIPPARLTQPGRQRHRINRPHPGRSHRCLGRPPGAQRPGLHQRQPRRLQPQPPRHPSPDRALLRALWVLAAQHHRQPQRIPPARSRPEPGLRVRGRKPQRRSTPVTPALPRRQPQNHCIPARIPARLTKLHRRYRNRSPAPRRGRLGTGPEPPRVCGRGHARRQPGLPARHRCLWCPRGAGGSVRRRQRTHAPDHRRPQPERPLQAGRAAPALHRPVARPVGPHPADPAGRLRHRRALHRARL